MFDAPTDHPLKQDGYHIIFCNDLGMKAGGHSSVLDTFYPFGQSNWVIIIHF
jgi:hypothetical protein